MPGLTVHANGSSRLACRYISDSHTAAPPHHLQGLGQDPWGHLTVWLPAWLGPRCCWTDKSQWVGKSIFFGSLFTRQHVSESTEGCKRLWWKAAPWPATSTLWVLSRGMEQVEWEESFSPLGPYSFIETHPNAVKLGCWVISRLVLPITLSTKVPIYSTQQKSRR